MIFDNIQKAREWFRDYKPLPENYNYEGCLHSDLFHRQKSIHNIKFGDWLLFNHIDGNSSPNTISRPILAVFSKFSIWDQALVINFIENDRAWMTCHEVYYSENKEYYGHACLFDSEIQTIQFWTDDIKVLGHWKQKPTIKQLKEALKTC